MPSKLAKPKSRSKPSRPGEDRKPPAKKKKVTPNRKGASVESAPSARQAAFKPVDALKLIPRDAEHLVLEVNGKTVKLTNLQKLYFPESSITKGDLLRYYASVSHMLLPHLRNRAMVMKRYPNGIHGEFFFMKRTPDHAPDWLELCSIDHKSKGVIDFPKINDLAALLWVVNLGCIDLNQWYAQCDDPDRPDYLHFDLDPVKSKRGREDVPFDRVRGAALAVRDGLAALRVPCYAKTSGSRGIHVYVPIKRGPLQKDVWTFAKAFAQTLARNNAEFMTAVYSVAKRPAGYVLVDYNQNAWGRTLASVYSVRPRPRATVSAPVTWKEVERGMEIDDFRLDNMTSRVKKLGDLFAPLLDEKDRFDLRKVL